MAVLLLCGTALCATPLLAQNDTTVASPESMAATTEMTAADSLLMTEMTEELPSPEDLVGEDVMAMQPGMIEGMGLHDQLKMKFVEGSASFMSLVAIVLILGLALCIERIIYLTLSEVNAKKLLRDVEKKVEANDMEGAKTLCRDTRGPVASICYQGLLHADEEMASVERNIVNYGMVQSGNLEKGCSWIRLFIAMAPSLGFLGTVIGMVIAFDQIQEQGDISPTIVAEGMKVALITTIFGIIVALVLQVFYNFILSKIERLTSQMEESAITLLDILMKRKLRQKDIRTNF